MKTKILKNITTILLVTGMGAWSAMADSIIAKGAKLKLLSRGFSFTEGPTCDSKGNVYFTDQNLDRILKWDTDGILTVFLTPSGRANGMYMDATDHLIACSDDKNELWKIAPDGTHEVLLKGNAYHDKLFNGPNDVWIHPNGDYYFTDPLYSRPWWGNQRSGQKMDGHHVYRLAESGGDPIRLTTNLKQPNGIIGTPDGKTLFVSDIEAGVIYKYKIQGDGSLLNRKIFCKAQSDGMTLDESGNLYLCNNRGVVVYDKEGEEIEVISVPENWTANVCFGGKNHNTLFITASKGLYSIQLTQKGANPSK